uniref:Terminase large subunit n=1 Tax=Salmonella phage PMBT19 TaxID=3229743 RepID=A0AB39C2R9_9CAUD
MNKGQYRAARRLIRENGIYALRWMDDDTAPIMDVLASQPDDQLETRAAIVAYSARAGLACSVRKTASLDLLARYHDRKAAANG